MIDISFRFWILLNSHSNYSSDGRYYIRTKCIFGISFTRCLSHHQVSYLSLSNIYLYIVYSMNFNPTFIILFHVLTAFTITAEGWVEVCFILPDLAQLWLNYKKIFVFHTSIRFTYVNIHIWVFALYYILDIVTLTIKYSHYIRYISNSVSTVLYQDVCVCVWVSSQCCSSINGVNNWLKANQFSKLSRWVSFM